MRSLKYKFGTRLKVATLPLVVSSMQSEENMPKSNRNTQKIINPLYRHPAWFFSIFFIIIIFVLVSQYFQGGLSACFTPTILAFGVLNLITPLVANYLYKAFSSLQAIVDSLTETNQKKWFLQQAANIFGVNIGSSCTAICLAIGGGAINYFMVGVVWTGMAKFFYFLHVTVLFGTLGILGWAYWGILLFSYRLQKLKLNSEPFESKRYEFEKISTLFLGVFFTGALLYIVVIIATWISPLVFFFEVLMFQYIIFPTAIVVICFFMLMQYFLHELMKKDKKIRSDIILSFISKLYNKWKKSQKSSHREAINDLLLWKEKIDSEKDFPFDFLTVVFALVTVLLPTLALFLPVIKSLLV